MGSVLVRVNDSMQQNYAYTLAELVGKNFHNDFKAELSPKDMLELEFFGGKYLNDCQQEFPSDWFEHAKVSESSYDTQINYFRVKASQPLAEWRRKGWIYSEDPRGWFQWYCRYYMGRRCPDDLRQIKRWNAMRRHITQLKRSCDLSDHLCRPRQRQALLHWAYDSRFM